MFFKKRPKRITTIFDLPVKEVKDKLTELSDIIYRIISSDSFVEISAKTVIPQNATMQDVQKLLKEKAPAKIKQILDLLIGDNFDDIIRASSLIFCEDYEFYRTRSLNQIAEDYASLSTENAGILIGFFTRAGR